MSTINLPNDNPRTTVAPDAIAAIYNACMPIEAYDETGHVMRNRDGDVEYLNMATQVPARFIHGGARACVYTREVERDITPNWVVTEHEVRCADVAVSMFYIDTTLSKFIIHCANASIGPVTYDYMQPSGLRFTTEIGHAFDLAVRTTLGWGNTHYSADYGTLACFEDIRVDKLIAFIDAMVRISREHGITMLEGDIDAVATRDCVGARRSTYSGETVFIETFDHGNTAVFHFRAFDETHGGEKFSTVFNVHGGGFVCYDSKDAAREAAARLSAHDQHTVLFGAA